MGTENKKHLVIRYSPNFAVSIIDSEFGLTKLVNRLQTVARIEIDPKIKLEAKVVDGVIMVEELLRS